MKHVLKLVKEKEKKTNKNNMDLIKITKKQKRTSDKKKII